MKGPAMVYDMVGRCNKTTFFRIDINPYYEDFQPISPRQGNKSL